MSKALTELLAPATDRLVGHDHAALEEQFLDVTQAQLEAEIPAHSATVDFGWETVTVIERFRFLHHAILRERPNNLTMPLDPLRTADTPKHQWLVIKCSGRSRDEIYGRGRRPNQPFTAFHLPEFHCRRRCEGLCERAATTMDDGCTLRGRRHPARFSFSGTAIGNAYDPD